MFSRFAKAALTVGVFLATVSQGAVEELQMDKHRFASLVGAPDVRACWKHVDFRGVGHLNKTCADDEESSMGLCYKKCSNSNAEGVGPLCVDSCPAAYGVSAGLLCCEDKQACTTELIDMGIKIPYDVIKAVIDGANPVAVVKDMVKLLHDLTGAVFKECK